jgi:hypothetical protein
VKIVDLVIVPSDVEVLGVHNSRKTEESFRITSFFSASAVLLD